MRAVNSTVIAAPLEQVWALLEDFTQWHDWLPGIDATEMEAGLTQGPVGSTRILTRENGTTIREKLVSRDDDQHVMSYTLVEPHPYPVRRFLGTVRLEPVTSTGATFVHWSADFDSEFAQEAELVETFGTIYRRLFDALAARVAPPEGGQQEQGVADVGAGGVPPMIDLPDECRELIASGKLAHMITLNRDGSPQATAVWVGIEDGFLMTGHTGFWRKLRNLERDPRVAITINADSYAATGAQHSLVVYGRAEIVKGGVYRLLRDMSRAYIPDLDETETPGARAQAWLEGRFPQGEDPDAGYVVRITPTKIGGFGPWSDLPVAARLRK